MLRFRNGVSRARSRERLALLNAERYCLSQAIQEYYWQLLVRDSVIIFDAHNLDPISCRVRWARYRGKLLTICTVNLAGVNFKREYKLRVDIPRGAHRELQVQQKRSRQW
jgi:hypothetical protein